MSLQRSILFLLIFVIFFGSCNSQIDSSDVQVIPIDETDEKEAEAIRMNNCGGKADASQTAERTKAINIGGELEIGANYQVVEGAVTAKYDQTNSSSKSLTLVAPPGTNMEFVLVWEQNVKTGLVTIDGKSGQAAYRISTPITVLLASSQDLGCQGIVQEFLVDNFPLSCLV